jgi:hypothetical protein
MNQLFGADFNKSVCVYLDDLLVFWRTEEEHCIDLRKVLNILQKNGLQAKQGECESFKKELKFLRHIFSAEGIKPDPAKVAVVKDRPTPTTVYDVRSFLGLTNCFRNFIRGYAAISGPLTELLKGFTRQDKKGRLLHLGKLRLSNCSKTRWTTKCQEAFDTLKAALTEAPVLAVSNFDDLFELVTDACETPPAIGGVLLHNGHPVACYSRKLSGVEMNYSVKDKDMLAIIWALCEWRCYLEGKIQFTLVINPTFSWTQDPVCTRCTGELAGWNPVGLTTCGAAGRDALIADRISRAPQHFGPTKRNGTNT